MTLQIEHIQKQYGKKTALAGVSLSITPGIFGLIGPNGAGKTTLMEILATILPPDHGSVRFHNRDLQSEPEQIRSELGYLPQQFGFYPNLTAVEFLDYLLLFYRVDSKTERKQRIELVLEQVGLQDVRGDKLKTYSGGMIRRIGIAQALLNNPRLLIVDEPTAGLDPEERVRFRQLLGRLVQTDPGRVVIISTHIINDIANIAQQIGILKQGSLLYSGSPSEFIRLNQNLIWEMEVDFSDVYLLEQQYPVLNTFPGEERSRVQILTAEPPKGARSVLPDLESAYFAFMRGEVL